MFASRSAIRVAGGIGARSTASNVARRQLRNPNFRRFQSTEAKTASDASVSPLVAGATGGLTAFVMGYAWYHLSGTSKVIQSAKSTIESFEKAKAELKEKSPNPSQALSFIRATTQQYLSLIPGAGGYVDSAFDELDSLSQSHGEEVNRILSETYNELRETVSNGAFDRATGEQAAKIIKRRSQQLKDLAKDAGSKLLDDNPQLKEQIGGTLGQLQQYGRQYGPEAQRVVDETYQQLQDMFKEGVSAGSAYQAAQLVQEKTKQVKDMGNKAAEKAWEEGVDQAQKYLDRSPELKKMFEEKKDDLKKLALSGGISTASIPSLFNSVREIAQSGGSKENVDKMKGVLEQTMQKGKGGMKDSMNSIQENPTWQSTLQTIESYIKSIPGGEQALKETPSLNELLEMGRRKGPEAERIAKETFQEISGILEKKMKEAKEVAKDR